MTKPLVADERTTTHNLTYYGVKFYPLEPRASDVLIEDIAHHLSLLCRFTGGIRCLYSVAEHSVRVAQFVSSVQPEHALWALLHDASEAYTNDVARPLKHTTQLASFRDIERQIMLAVLERFNLPQVEPAIVRETDRRICLTEAAQLRDHGREHWGAMMEHAEGWTPLPITIEPWSPDVAKRKFLQAFQLYGGRL